VPPLLCVEVQVGARGQELGDRVARLLRPRAPARADILAKGGGVEERVREGQLDHEEAEARRPDSRLHPAKPVGGVGMKDHAPPSRRPVSAWRRT
jgi:hypothetical protein